MKDNCETVIECDGIEITKDELWEEIKSYEGWDITITFNLNFACSSFYLKI